MTPDGWRRVKEIVGAALELPASERRRFADEACGSDAGLRADVERLLAQESGSLESPLAGLRTPELREGQALGHYRVVRKLGQGGMGAVYQAEDQELHRMVALKVLPGLSTAAADSASRNRLLAEARAMSTLTHPNIVAVHQVGSAEGVDFIVMEFVKGSTLAERIPAGGMPVWKLVDLAMQIAAGLAKAHTESVVHGDVKPRNVMVTPEGEVKVVDFGVARMLQSQAGSAESGGTAAYMSPEQARGEAVDARSDIFSFGAVLYEMASGRRAFDGIESVLHSEPPPLDRVPREFARIVDRCLRKDPNRRYQHIADVRIALEDLHVEVAPGQADASKSRSWKLAAAAACLLLVTAVAAGTWWSRGGGGSRHAADEVVRSSLLLSDSGLSLALAGLAISPDGQTVVFGAKSADSEARLYARRLSERAPRPIAGTEGSSYPFFSPDGEWIGFSVANRGYFKVPVAGGPVQKISDESGYGGVWLPSGQIIQGLDTEGLGSVSADGRAGEIAIPCAAKGDRYLWPSALPGQKDFLFTAYREGRSAVAVYSSRTGKVARLIENAGHGMYVDGYLVYVAQGRLFAAPFDPGALELKGTAQIVAEDLGIAHSFAGAPYSISPAGTLVYVPAQVSLTRLVWRDREGRTTPLPHKARNYSSPVLSPDSKRLAVLVMQGAAHNIWVGDVDGEPLSPVTFGADDYFPLFSPDGKRVVYTAGREGRYNLFWTPSDGSGPPERLTEGAHWQKPTSWSRDGRVLLMNDLPVAANGERMKGNVLQVNFAEGRAVTAVAQTAARELEGKFSPDGRFIAYASDESGEWEIYVRGYPDGVKRQVSVGGGNAPEWNPMGGELFYVSPSGEMWALPISGGRPAGSAKQLFGSPGGVATRGYAVSRDGQRFLFVENVESPRSPQQLHVVSNWVGIAEGRTRTAQK